jgi:replicative DNA helicase
MLDHILLTKGKSGESERETISKLQNMFMEVKKYNRTTIIQLSQLNRDIESIERISNSSLHYPLAKDLFASDVIYQTSDYVFIIHRPETLGIEHYGSKMIPTEGLAFGHFLKLNEPFIVLSV